MFNRFLTEFFDRFANDQTFGIIVILIAGCFAACLLSGYRMRWSSRTRTPMVRFQENSLGDRSRHASFDVPRRPMIPLTLAGPSWSIPTPAEEDAKNREANQHLENTKPLYGILPETKKRRKRAGWEDAK